MTKAEDIEAGWALVDQATNALADRIQVLIDDINSTATDGLNAAQTENTLARLGAMVVALNGLGKNPSDPVPPEPPEPEPMPGPFLSSRKN
jgi:hypothetical protein